MRNPFALRRPWAAALIALIFGPFVGFLYLGRGRTALAWLAAELCVALAVIAFVPRLIAAGQPVDAGSIGEWTFHVVGCVPAYFSARQRNPGPPPIWYARWYALAGIWVIFPVVALGIRFFAYQPFDVRSGSMRPTLDVGDYIAVSKLAYRTRPPVRGDVVVFYSQAQHENYIKRIVGMPGERVWLRGGVVFVDGRALPQRRTRVAWTDCGMPKPCRADVVEERVPGGRSYRTLDFGPMVLDNMPELRVPAGSYFVLGDNRDDSLDSREPDFGFVARGDIVGQATHKFVTAGHWTWQDIR